ncbi:CocE/NonD family hydrolase [Falsiroseomonas tokyonensis]|uniref:CocE/NonD family hydrolase n=1 Tax=Falsiroseomonas tokyonensis TaxID=430521 RepID=A0ABV7C0H1_9PROT|nr:CocE/NonD family hydrolase [Falsiroseomonas tokyonensis]MBU8540408.1 CocE/NonD family hydrolase [Falsiroseomonas tokyonensis]
MRCIEAMVPCRDGVRLATDAWLPDGEGPWPVILERTPYGKREVSRSERTAADPKPQPREAIAAYFVQHGYVVVYQDCRGRYGSEGEFVKYLSDGEDGYDCCAWIMAQPWCNGRIGTMGLSYAAHTQASLGCLDPPGLAVQILDSGGFSDAWQGGIRRGGAFELKQASWAFNQALLAPETKADPVRAAALAAEDLVEWFHRFPWKRGHSPVRHAPDYEDYLFEQWEHGARDEFWQRLGIFARGWHDRYAPVPTVHMSSWYDPYPRTATENYCGLRDAGRGRPSLILGPWTHGNRSQTAFGEVEFGSDATIDSWAGDWRAFRLRVFDRWLKDVRNGVEAEPPVRVFVMGGGSGRRTEKGLLDHGGRWRNGADWPLPGTRIVPYHLHGDGGLAEATPAANAAPLSWDSDPRHPVPTIGGAITSMEPVITGGPMDQREREGHFGCRPPFLPLASRADVLVFQTPPLDHDLEVIGPVTAELWIATDAPDTDITAKLIDVHPASADYPQGFAMNLCEGILRCRYRDDPAQPSWMPHREPTAITVELFPTANRFLAGHRIRLDIAASEFPHYDVNPQTGEKEGAARRMRLAVNTLFCDADHPSRLLLPLAPPDDG